MKSYFRGKYGRPPAPINPDLLKRVLGDEQPIEGRPADLLTETVEQYRLEIGALARSEEDVLSYALFPNAARGFFERRHKGADQDVFLTAPADQEPVGAAAPIATDRLRELVAVVESSGVDEITVEDGGGRVTIRKSGARPLTEASPAVATGPAAQLQPAAAASPPPAGAAEDPAPAAFNGYHKVVAPMVGTFYTAASPGTPPYVAVGQHVAEGDVLCILEAMKLMNEVGSEVSGVVRAILVANGAAVEYGQPLFAIELDA